MRVLIACEFSGIVRVSRKLADFKADVRELCSAAYVARKELELSGKETVRLKNAILAVEKWY